MSYAASHPALYSALKFGEQFKMMHHLRHAAYDKAASRQGISVPGLDLTGEITRDWLLRHSVRHKTYRKVSGTVGSTSTVDLESLHWEDERSVRDWMHYHARLHALLDVYFGVVH